MKRLWLVLMMPTLVAALAGCGTTDAARLARARASYDETCARVAAADAAMTPNERHDVAELARVAQAALLGWRVALELGVDAADAERTAMGAILVHRAAAIVYCPAPPEADAP